MTEFLIFMGVLLAAPPLIFTAAVLFDHLLHGPTETHHEER
jgi:hypothetical protein